MKKRDLLLADTHILELAQECNESAAAERGAVPQLEDTTSPSMKDGGRRKAKDVELLYEELQKELWAVVRESLRSPTAGPNLGLVVQVSPDFCCHGNHQGNCRDGKSTRIFYSSKFTVTSFKFKQVKLENFAQVKVKSSSVRK